MEGGNPLKLQFTNELFQFTEAHRVDVNFLYEEESKEEALAVSGVTLTVQTIMKTSVLDGDISIDLLAQVNKETKKLSLQLEKTLVENPEHDVVLKARLQCANRQIFDLIQSVQNQDAQRRKIAYEDLKNLDRDIDLYMEDAMKIKNREIKRELMDQALDCKRKVAKVIEILRGCLTSSISNLQIAQLNDCAYKAIRKVGV